MLSKFLLNEDGATSIEYALVGALMAITAIGAVTALGNNVSTMWATIASAMN